MYLHICFMGLLLVCLQMVSSQVSVSYNYLDIKCTTKIVLKCTYTGGINCCSDSTRLWFKGSTQILSDGVSSQTGKYSEGEISASNKQFSLVINNLVENDLDQDYKCSYALTTSPAYRLENKDELINCAPCPTCGGRTCGWGFLGLLLAIGLLTVIVFCLALNLLLRIILFIGAVSVAISLHLSTYIAFLVGIYACICYGFYDTLFVAVMVVFFCPLVFIKLCQTCIRKDSWIKEYRLRFALYILTFGLLLVYDWCKGDKASVGSTVVLKCPYKVANKTQKITWYKIVDGKAVRYSEEENIDPKLSPDLISRLKVSGDNEDGEGEYHLRISNVQENDKGTYQCSLSDTAGAVHRLKLSVAGGKSQSVESGSSCWPICRVGQDPNTSSSGPEKVRRSPEKERADKKKERKPTEVVRPQPSRPLPSRAQHLKTDNTGREEYSAENELFKPRPLPSISGHSDSPRPLPKRTPDDQLEKGGIQLEPLVDSTSEKKKKKKRKKKETKQSDEDD